METKTAYVPTEEELYAWKHLRWRADEMPDGYDVDRLLAEGCTEENAVSYGNWVGSASSLRQKVGALPAEKVAELLALTPHLEPDDPFFTTRPDYIPAPEFAGYRLAVRTPASRFYLFYGQRAQRHTGHPNQEAFIHETLPTGLLWVLRPEPDAAPEIVYREIARRDDGTVYQYGSSHENDKWVTPFLRHLTKFPESRAALHPIVAGMMASFQADHRSWWEDAPIVTYGMKTERHGYSYVPTSAADIRAVETYKPAWILVGTKGGNLQLFRAEHFKGSKIILPAPMVRDVNWTPNGGRHTSEWLEGIDVADMLRRHMTYERAADHSWFQWSLRLPPNEHGKRHVAYWSPWGLSFQPGTAVLTRLGLHKWHEDRVRMFCISSTDLPDRLLPSSEAEWSLD